MDSRAVKVFLACALGGGIGSTIALRVESYLWWVGLLMGGAVGYFSYEFREVLRAVRVATVVAWHETVSVPPAVFTWISRTVKSPKAQERMLRLGLALLPPIAAASSVTAVFLVMPHASIPLTDADGFITGPAFAVGFLGYFFVGGTAGFSIIYATLKSKGEYQASMKALGIAALCLTPIGLSLFAVALPVLGIGYVLLKSPTIARFCAVFVKMLFLTIHSEIRLLCAVDAGIGMLIGYFFADPIIGAIAGGIIGVANYKLISQRLLHLHFREQRG